MRRTAIASVIALLVCSLYATAQHDKEGCHVYVVDVAKSKSLASLTPAQLKECEKTPEKCGVVEFPEFMPSMEEEELTLKTYKFPWAPLTITASVYTTDEMWIADTATLTITLAHGSPKDVQADENSAQADIVLGDVNATKVKRYYRVKDKQYLVGLQCIFGKIE